jgi:hypothetical protein|tara:strand:+ start:1955 stop:2677 length:723 start_codon:yes stop_codon:yes gene_type:complete
MGSNGYSIEFGDKLIDDCDEGIVKEGNRYKIKVFYDDGVVRDKLCSVRNINKCVVEVDGEKNEISELKGVLDRIDWFKDWNISFVDCFNGEVYNDDSKRRERFYVNVDYGKKLEIYNYDIGRVLLSCSEKNRDRRIKLEILEIFEKGSGKGKSVLTILNRVCKGLDILVEFMVGEIISSDKDIERRKRREGDREFDRNRLVTYYKDRGFRVRGKENVSKVMMDSKEILDEYVKRMGWDDE